MRPRSSDTRQKILDAAYRLFYRSGYARVGIDAIAEAAGFTKRTLYQHFDSKDSLIAAVMQAQHEFALTRIRHWIDADADTPLALVNALFAGLADWAASPEWRGSGFSRAAIEFSDLPGHPARRAARHHKRAVEDSLARALAARGQADTEYRARALMLLLEGCHTLVLIHGDLSYIAAARHAARVLVGAGNTTEPGESIAAQHREGA